MVLVVLLATAGIVISILGFNAGDFAEEISRLIGDSSCDIGEEKFREDCDCDNPGQDPDPADYVEDPNECSWTNDLTCSDVCS